MQIRTHRDREFLNVVNHLAFVPTIAAAAAATFSVSVQL